MLVWEPYYYLLIKINDDIHYKEQSWDYNDPTSIYFKKKNVTLIVKMWVY